MIRNNAILSFLQDLGLRILNKKAVDANTKSELVNAASKGVSTGATIAQTGANNALLATMWPILVATLAIVAALALLAIIVIGIVALVKWFNANSPEGKLKSAEEAADAAAKAAERTAEAYNNLVEAIENLSDQYSALEEMTRGTQEWRDAVKEVNDAVLSLIEDYPKLAALVKHENGVLTLDLESQEVQEVLNQYEKEATAAQNVSLVAKINAKEKKAAARADKIAKNVAVQLKNYDEEMSAPTIEALARAM